MKLFENEKERRRRRRQKTNRFFDFGISSVNWLTRFGLVSHSQSVSVVIHFRTLSRCTKICIIIVSSVSRDNCARRRNRDEITVLWPYKRCHCLSDKRISSSSWYAAKCRQFMWNYYFLFFSSNVSVVVTRVACCCVLAVLAAKSVNWQTNICSCTTRSSSSTFFVRRNACNGEYDNAF